MADTYKAPNVKKYTEAMKKKAKEAAKIKAAKAKKKDDSATVTTSNGKTKLADSSKKTNGVTTFKVDGKLESGIATSDKKSKAEVLAALMRKKRAKMKKGECATVKSSTGKKVKFCKK